MSLSQLEVVEVHIPILVDVGRRDLRQDAAAKPGSWLLKAQRLVLLLDPLVVKEHSVERIGDLLEAHHVGVALQDHLDDGSVPLLLVELVEPNIITHDAQRPQVFDHGVVPFLVGGELTLELVEVIYAEDGLAKLLICKVLVGVDEDAILHQLLNYWDCWRNYVHELAQIWAE